MTRPGRRSSRGVRKIRCSPSRGLKTGCRSGFRPEERVSSHLPSRANADAVLSPPGTPHGGFTGTRGARCSVRRPRGRGPAAGSSHRAPGTPDGLRHGTHPEALALGPARVQSNANTKAQGGPGSGRWRSEQARAAEGGRRPLPTHTCRLLTTPQAGPGLDGACALQDRPFPDAVGRLFLQGILFS